MAQVLDHQLAEFSLIVTQGDFLIKYSGGLIDPGDALQFDVEHERG